MAWSKSKLEDLAITIKDETGEGKNTAERVGQMFYQLIQFADSKGKTPGGGGTFDPSQLEDAISQLRSDLDNIFNREKDKVTEIVNEVLDGKNFVNGWQAGWNNKLKAYLIDVGVLGANGQDKGWAYLEIKYNEIKAAVNAAKLIIDQGGNPVSWEALSSHFEQYIENSQAIASLRNLYSLSNSERNILRWLDAGFEIEASPNSGLAKLFAAAEDTAKNTRAISTLTTEVTDKASKQEIGGLVSQALRNSEVISEAGLLLTEDLGSAIANLFATHETISYTPQGGQTKSVSTAGLNFVTTDLDANVWIGAGAPNSVYPGFENYSNIELLSGGGINLYSRHDPYSGVQVHIGNGGVEVTTGLNDNKITMNSGTVTALGYALSNISNEDGAYANLVYDSEDVLFRSFEDLKIVAQLGELEYKDITMECNEMTVHTNKIILNRHNVTDSSNFISQIVGDLDVRGDVDISDGDLHLYGNLYIKTDGGTGSIDVDGHNCPISTLSEGLSSGSFTIGGATFTITNGIITNMETNTGGVVHS